MRELTLVLAATVAAMSLGGCSKSGELVRSRAAAISIARSEWGPTFVGDRKLHAGRYGGKWIVTRERRVGDASEESIFVDARSGQVTRSSVQTGDLILDRK